MREIKFRAWAGGVKRMDYSTLNFISFDGKRILFGNGDITGFHDSVMQFTGLHDKDGREIYEGDITECFAFGLTTVEFRSGSFGLYSKHQGFFPFNDIHGRVKVIGNIHENPKLLNS